jgi:hypothetical protein
MTTRRPLHSRFLAALGSLTLTFAAACDSSPTDPSEVEVDLLPESELQVTSLTRADLTASGRVVETADGYTVDGALTMASEDRPPVTFTAAQLRVRFDEGGRVTSIQGTTEIPSPHERITFDDPVRAGVGLFRGSFLNRERDLGILLKDDTDYFVFDFAVALRMNIATGETGEEATKPITVQAPVGGRLLMITDFTDPMYYVYGQQDLIGAAGMGWSLNSRIPFVPARPVDGLGTFDGKNTRVGSFPVFKVLKVTGQMVDNEYTEVHLSERDPFSSDLRRGYQAGYNGAMVLDLSVADVVGLEIPVADGSGGVWAEASMQDVFRGHAYARGLTSRDASWWPSFIPARPITELEVEARVQHTGSFAVGLAGAFGWELPDGRHAMNGGFRVSDEALTLTGSMQDGAVTFTIKGVVTKAATTVSVEPPPQLLEAIARQVNDDVLPRIDEAQRRWEDLKEATADYEIELSLRGLRSSLPAIASAAQRELSEGIAAELNAHRGKVYYNSLRSHLNAEAARYDAVLDRLATEARRTSDNAQTRVAIESALRDVAARKIFRTTYRYRDPIFGTTLVTVDVARRIMSDANAARLIQAADNVHRIRETSDVRISMQRIYDEVDDKALFEQVRDDVKDGLLVMRTIGELGFVYRHGQESPRYDVFAVIDGRRYQAGALSAVTVAAFGALLPEVMLEALKVN